MKTNWDKLQQALDGLKKDSPEGFTSREFCQAIGFSQCAGVKKLAELIHAGKAKFVGNRPVVRIDGRGGVNPVYALVNKSKSRKALTV